MNQLKEKIITLLNNTRSEARADFSALACQEPVQGVIRWKYAVGNQNERFRRIVLHSGKGIAGKVLLSGRPTQVVNYQPMPHDDPREYPILYAEQLRTALGVPVYIDKRVHGVLLIGYRSDWNLTIKEISLTQRYAKELEALFTQYAVQGF
ncbi:MAG: GAF domain-containing protein [Sporomusaceae bacterium]|nr:GAF domain-containing protein [Sporomusaceae bacterium]